MIADLLTQACRDWAERSTLDKFDDLLTHHVRMHTGIAQSSGRDLIYSREDVVRHLLAERRAYANVVVRTCESFEAAAMPGDSAAFLQLEFAATRQATWPMTEAGGARVLHSSFLLALSLEGRIFRLWWFVDHRQIAHGAKLALASLAQRMLARLPAPIEAQRGVGEVRADFGQVPAQSTNFAFPGADGATLSLLYRWLGAWNGRRIDELFPLYSSAAVIHGLAGSTTTSAELATHPWMALIELIPDAVFFLERCLQEPNVEPTTGASRVVLLWRVIGHARRASSAGTEHVRLHVQGLSILTMRAAKIASERLLYDELGVELDLARAARLSHRGE